MSQMSNAIDSAAETHTAVGFLFRFFVIALTAFLTPAWPESPCRSWWPSV
jgi:hypothetical protein